MEVSDIDKCRNKREAVAAEIAAQERASVEPTAEAQAAPAADDTTR